MGGIQGWTYLMHGEFHKMDTSSQVWSLNQATGKYRYESRYGENYHTMPYSCTSPIPDRWASRDYLAKLFVTIGDREPALLPLTV